MNVFEFKKIEKCYVCGNIDRNIDKFINLLTSNVTNYEKETHPKELERQERLKKRTNTSRHSIFARPYTTFRDEPQVTLSATYNKKMKSKGMIDTTYNDCVIIVSGNCGIGRKSIKYYNEVFSNLDKILGDNNSYLLFVRGNNDNPSIFKNREIDFEHVKVVPDYSVIQLKTFNCLCIGGSVSIDKEWKLSQEKTFGRKMYWEDEAPIFDENALDEILQKYQIDCVITSTSPSFSYPGTNAFKHSKWFNNDKTILGNFTNERKILDKIYEKINDSDSKPYLWFYGRFKMAHSDKINDIVFTSLLPYQFTQVNSLLSMYFGINTSEKLASNDHTFDKILNEPKNNYGYAIHPIGGHLEEPVEAVEENEAEDDVEEELDGIFEETDVPWNGTTVEVPNNDAFYRVQMPQYQANYTIFNDAVGIGR